MILHFYLFSDNIKATLVLFEEVYNKEGNMMSEGQFTVIFSVPVENFSEPLSPYLLE